MPGSLQAVFWDMDGTLVDTEPHWIREETALVESFGARWTDSHAEDCVGQALPLQRERSAVQKPRGVGKRSRRRGMGRG